MANTVCQLSEQEGVVCAMKLRKYIFTTGNVDNIDHNPSSRTANDSFHGTAISLTQHPSKDLDGVDRSSVIQGLPAQKQRKISELPISNTNIHPVSLPKIDDYVPAANRPLKPSASLINEAMKSAKTGWKQHNNLHLYFMKMRKQGL